VNRFPKRSSRLKLFVTFCDLLLIVYLETVAKDIIIIVILLYTSMTEWCSRIACCVSVDVLKAERNVACLVM